jgi:large subunit ribosomal protein L15
MKLSDLKPAAGAVKPKKRIGRGIGSGHGKTAGRGHKGRGSRSGGFRRLQKNAARREEFAEVNLKSLTGFDAGAPIDPAALIERGIIRSGRKVKILGDGEVSGKLTVRAHAFSKGAREKIAAAGGAAELIETPQKLNA